MCKCKLSDTITPPPPVGSRFMQNLSPFNSGPTICMLQQKFKISSDDEIHQTSWSSPVFNCPVSVNLYPLQLQIPVLGWQKRKLMGSSAVAVHQDATCCVFWHAFLFTTVVKSGYLSTHSLKIPVDLLGIHLQSITGHHAHTVTHLFIPKGSFRVTSLLYVFERWEEIRKPRGIPHRLSCHGKHTITFPRMHRKL